MSAQPSAEGAWLQDQFHALQSDGLATFSPMGGGERSGVLNGNRIVGMSRLALVATDGLPLIGER